MAVSNGSPGPYVIRPDDFSYEHPDGRSIRAVPAQTVIAMLMQKGSGTDVIKLVTAYEAGIYGNPHLRSTTATSSAGRRRSRWAAPPGFGPPRPPAPSPWWETKLAMGDSTDGAVFFPNEGKPLTGGHIVVRTNTDTFTFRSE